MGNNNSYSSENCKPTKIMETLKLLMQRNIYL